jgi:hypothetical protein
MKEAHVNNLCEHFFIWFLFQPAMYNIFFVFKIFILQSLLHVWIHLYHPQGVPNLCIAKVTQFL